METHKPKNIDDYITNFPVETREILERIRATIRRAAPAAVETIKYGMPAFTLKGNLVYFAAYKKHIGLYAVPTDLEEFKKELSPYKTGSGSVQFPLDKPIPLRLIARLV